MEIKERAAVMAMIDKKIKADEKESRNLKNKAAKKPRRR
jgi:hypothetical protein